MLGERASYAVAPVSDFVPTKTQAADADDLAQTIAEAVASAIMGGLNNVADGIFAAIPKEVILRIGERQIARAIWGPLEEEARNRNRIFAPTRATIVRIAGSGGSR